MPTLTVAIDFDTNTAETEDDPELWDDEGDYVGPPQPEDISKDNLSILEVANLLVSVADKATSRFISNIYIESE